MGRVFFDVIVDAWEMLDAGFEDGTHGAADDFWVEDVGGRSDNGEVLEVEA